MSCCDCKLKGLYYALKMPLIRTQSLRIICEDEGILRDMKKQESRNWLGFSDDTRKKMKEDIEKQEAKVLEQIDIATIAIHKNLAEAILSFLIDTEMDK